MSEWISVEDRLPEVGEEVFIYSPNGLHTMGVWDTATRTKHYWCIDMCAAWGYDSYREKISSSDITHWMPLPEPPDVGITTGNE